MNETSRLRAEILELRMKVYSLEAENGELKRRLRVQAASMEDARRAAYAAFTSTVQAMSQKEGTC